MKGRTLGLKRLSVEGCLLLLLLLLFLLALLMPIWYTCGAHLVHPWYPFGTPVVPIWYTCGTHLSGSELI